MADIAAELVAYYFSAADYIANRPGGDMVFQLRQPMHPCAICRAAPTHDLSTVSVTLGERCVYVRCDDGVSGPVQLPFANGLAGLDVCHAHWPMDGVTAAGPFRKDEREIRMIVDAYCKRCPVRNSESVMLVARALRDMAEGRNLVGLLERAAYACPNRLCYAEAVAEYLRDSQPEKKRRDNVAILYKSVKDAMAVDEWQRFQSELTVVPRTASQGARSTSVTRSEPWAVKSGCGEIRTRSSRSPAPPPPVPASPLPATRMS